MTPRIHVQVVARQRMAPRTPALPTVQGGWRGTSENVGAPRDRLQMGWIAAGRPPTKMIEVESCRDRSYEQLVGESMNPDGAPVTLDASVSTVRASPPSPATI